jgi:hypothetical protein
MHRHVAYWVVVTALVMQSAWADSPGPHQNIYRAYPPSCLADPLPVDPSGPTWIFPIDLSVDSPNASKAFESDTLTFWRTPCTGGMSALLARIDRPSDATAPNPLIPKFHIVVGDAGADARIAPEPNTVRSRIVPGTEFIDTYPSDGGIESTGDFVVFVLENEATYFANYIDYSAELKVYVDTGVSCGFPECPPVTPFVIPAYDPSQYPQASQSMPISGYLAGDWYDPAHSGEGIQTEIDEFEGADSFLTSRYLVVAWYAYDELGQPYWLFGSGTFNAGDRQVQVQIAYSSGGGFAGSRGRAASFPWGGMTVDFPDCSTMHFAFASDPTVPPNIPQGTGSRTWQRLSMINGLNCQ